MATWLGIDIQKRTVKATVVRSRYRKLSLEALAIEQIEPPSSSISSNNSQRMSTRHFLPLTNSSFSKTLGETIKRAIASLLLSSDVLQQDGIAIALHGSQTAIRNIVFPLQTKRRLKEILPFELEGELPFDLSEAVFDYRILDQRKDPSSLSLIVGIARIEIVKRWIEMVQQAIAVEPHVVGVGAFPLVHLSPFISKQSQEEPIAFLDLRQEDSDLLILVNNKPVFARTLSSGTNHLLDGSTLLTHDFSLSMAGYQAAGGVLPAQLILCGDAIHSLDQLSEQFKIPTEIFSLSNSEKGERLLLNETINPGDLPKFAKAIGLALSLRTNSQALNLRQGSLAYERKFEWLKTQIPVLVTMGLIVWLHLLFSLGAHMYVASKEEKRLVDSLSAVTREVLGEETQDAVQANELLSSLMNIQDQDPMPHADAFDVMVRLAEVVPPSMVHNIEELDVQKGRVVVHGIVSSIPEAQAIASSLSKLACFSDVKIASTHQAIGSERQKYTLEFEIKCPIDVKSKKKEGIMTASLTHVSSKKGEK
ncbi:pilus assembly protein PilM [Pajaroellobacter abortibovis]|uniref:GspL periplasmic domain-containing protein n=1 Tax=Pajaroellobacter abortibovis TaxID=1882918 RepID=A0A1L6MX41_9BACT|nr:pilus assembly protein PilM [Pajaroellobacter abortibovis]APS00025.1 hypothetical protein BCY86_04490 [Pajaroellobacter abortibovis]